MNIFKVKIRELFQRFGHFLLGIGIDPRRLKSFKNLNKFYTQSKVFKSKGGVISHYLPVLIDYDSNAGSVKGHYFHQDLLVASFIFNRNPERHIDIGSRIDGFVAHIASFRKIEVMDVRNLPESGHSNITFIKANLMDQKSNNDSVADSISCLHAIEHFGLGRYGDQIDPDGHLKGFNNIVAMLKRGGILYISFPIANEPRVYFNAHRVFHPRDVLAWNFSDSQLKLLRFDFVDDFGGLHQDVDLYSTKFNLRFGCGIYTFIKN